MISKTFLTILRASGKHVRASRWRGRSQFTYFFGLQLTFFLNGTNVFLTKSKSLIKIVSAESNSLLGIDTHKNSKVLSTSFFHVFSPSTVPALFSLANNSSARASHGSAWLRMSPFVWSSGLPYESNHARERRFEHNYGNICSRCRCCGCSYKLTSMSLASDPVVTNAPLCHYRVMW